MFIINILYEAIIHTTKIWNQKLIKKKHKALAISFAILPQNKIKSDINIKIYKRKRNEMDSKDKRKKKQVNLESGGVWKVSFWKIFDRWMNSREYIYMYISGIETEISRALDLDTHTQINKNININW